MHDCEGEEHCTGMTARQEVEAILRGEWDVIGLVGPMFGTGWIPGFLARLRAECGGHELSGAPGDLARAAGFRVRGIYLPGRCGASTCDALWIPLRGDVRERNLACAHELLHGLGLRLGLYLNETDWWLCTAAFVAVAAQSEEGALLYPFWMLEAVPSHLIPG